MAQGVTFPIKISANSKELTVLVDDVEEFTTKINEATNATKKFGKSSENVGSLVVALDSVNNVIGNLNSQVQKITSSFNSFETSMRAVNTMAGMNEEEFDALTDSVTELGKTIPKTREELANGLYQVISNGVPQDNWLSFLEESAKASVGGIADLGQVVTVTSTIIKNYGASWSDAGSIQDKIQMTAKNGVTSFEQLAAALPRVSGSAATLGVSIDELMATFATLTGVSGNTAEVSTQLSAVFTALIKPSSEASKMAEEMGIRFDAATITAAGGLEQFLVQLDECVKEYSASSGVLETEVYGRLFGSAESVRALIPLTGELSAKYSENVAAMSDSTGTIDQAFQQMSSTGEANATMFRNGISAITDWAGSILSTKAPCTEMLTSLGQTIISVTAIGTSINKLVNSEKVVTAATKVWSVVQMALNAVMSANPIAIVVLAIAGLVAGIITAYKHCDKFREICDKIISVVKKLVGMYISALVKGFEKITSAVKKAWEWLKKLFGIGSNDNADTVNAIAEETDAIEDETDAIESQTEAVKELGDAKKNTGSIKLTADGQNGTSDKDRNKNKNNKPVAQQGSIGYLENQISDLQAKLKLEVDPASQVAIQRQIDQLTEQKDKIELEIDLKVNGLKDLKKLDNAFDRYKQETPEIKVNLPVKDMSNYTKETKKAKTASENASESFGAMGVLMNNIGECVDGAAQAWLQYGSNLLNTVAQAIPAIAQMIAANSAETASENMKTTAQTASAASGVLSAHSEIPFVGIALGLAGVAAIVAAMMSLPKFAAGGIAYGPTLGLMGEYAGAANNPEVIAPLNKLRTLLNVDNGTSGGKVDFEIRGRKLVGVLAKETSVRSRR